LIEREVLLEANLGDGLGLMRGFME
jgi:hypothetical protein